MALLTVVALPMRVRAGATPAGGRVGAGARGPGPPGCDTRGGALPAAAGIAGLAAAILAGCASLDPVPLRPEPVPWADTLPIAEPAERTPNELAEFFEDGFLREAGVVTDVGAWVGREREATNLTHFDDVVGSAWFEHRNGKERLSPARVGAGAASAAGPDTSRALTVVAGKSEGVMPGFTVTDGRGDRYVLKFDPKGNLHLASAADVIASRLLWAAGYHVPADYIVVFDRDRLALAEGARISTEDGSRAMREADVERILGLANPLPDGRYLALASRVLPGRPKGPFAFGGVRKDDPNDYYLHEYRRELRGLFVVAAWLNHIDLRSGNTLDMFIDPPGYLKHYLIDFASALGSGGIRPHHAREGLEYNFDLWPTLARMVTLGFHRVGWEGEPREEIHPTIGWMPVETFDPGAWKPNWPNPAFKMMTAADGYWGAKLVGSFTDDQIRAAVAAGGLPDPAAADTLVAILAHRRDRILEHWYARVTPVEDVRARLRPPAGGEPSDETDAARVLVVEFEDRGLAAGVWSAPGTGYRWRFRDPARGGAAAGEALAAEGPLQRLEIPLPTPRRDAAGTTTAAGSTAAAGGTVSAVAPEEDDTLATLHLRAFTPAPAERTATVYLRWRGGDRGYEVVGLLH